MVVGYTPSWPDSCATCLRSTMWSKRCKYNLDKHIAVAKNKQKNVLVLKLVSAGVRWAPEESSSTISTKSQPRQAVPNLKKIMKQHLLGYLSGAMDEWHCVRHFCIKIWSKTPLQRVWGAILRPFCAILCRFGAFWVCRPPPGPISAILFALRHC